MDDRLQLPDRDVAPVHLPPRLIRLGTLAELTQGGHVGPDDGLGGQNESQAG